MHGIALFASFVPCARPLCHADDNVDIIQDQPAQPGSSHDQLALKRAPGLVPTLRRHKALAGQPSASHMGQIPFRANPLGADKPSSPEQPNACTCLHNSTDRIGAEPASEGKEDEEEGREHEDDLERGHAASSVARYEQHD